MGRRLVVCAVLAVAAPAGAQAPGGVFRDCDVCPEMVPLPEGDVALGRFEVTLGEYRAFAEAVPGVPETGCVVAGRQNTRVWTWRHPGYPQTGEHPVACVSWNEAQVYARWLSLVTGQQYRLPTDAEWDRGAAGSPRGCYQRIRNRGGTCAVGSYTPSGAGLFDMVGNVWEWTDNCWNGNCDRRVMRGGGWLTE
ncbi:MAG: SUMF1/EgtB/PvdO family nonheme iron enzyme, partial [Acidobacteria bacterium]|nr:SUMF1/EgtB/PvdO family nonheme iron enzyme [Acidobacteriota bacterium]